MIEIRTVFFSALYGSKYASDSSSTFAFDIISVVLFRADELLAAHSVNLSDEEPSDEPVAELVFYDSGGRRVADPPVETTISIDSAMCVEKFIALLLREYTILGFPKMNTQSSPLMRALTKSIVLSQGFLYDPIRLAKLRWGTAPNVMPAGDCLVFAAAMGFFQNLDRATAITAAIIPVISADRCCIASGIAAMILIHSLMHKTQTVENAISTAIAAGLKWLPKSRHSTFKSACSGTIGKIMAAGIQNHVYGSLGIIMHATKLFSANSSMDNLTRILTAVSQQTKTTNDQITAEINRVFVGIIYGCISNNLSDIDEFAKAQPHYRYMFSRINDFAAKNL